MIVKKQPHTAGYILVLAGALSLAALPGCASPQSADEESAAAEPVMEAEAPDTAADAPKAESAAVAEVRVLPSEDSSQLQPESAVAAAGSGPGDGPPPPDETRKKVEALEQSLAPLQAVPAVPPS